MSDNDDDLFADSDDTAELIGNSAPEPKKAATKKLGGGGAAKRKRNEGKAKIPDADDNNDSDDDDDSDDGKGLFDSDDSDDDAPAKKPAAKKAKKEKKPMSKRERMEALQKKKRLASGIDDSKPAARPRRDPSEKKAPKTDGNESDSGDSYNSAEFQLNEDDRNFIDTEGDDADALNELYSEQHFDDRRGEAEEDMEYNKKGRKGGGRGGGGRKGGNDTLDTTSANADLDNPIMAAVHKMKKKKRESKKLTELEEEAKEFMDAMERAAEEDELAVKERRPATKRLTMINTVVDTFTNREITRVLLDLDVLSICKRWIKPLPNGALGNVTVRQKMLDAIANMTGEAGITPADLKRSEFGKVVMSLYMHKSETPAMKRKLKALIEQWSRPIFQKSGNMRDLERVHTGRGEGGIAGISRLQMQEKSRAESATKGPAVRGSRKNIDSLIKSGKQKGGAAGMSRVRVPYSKGFQYTVRPTARTDVEQNRGDKGGKGEVRGNLSKRMLEKGRAVAKNQRSANISVEGRATKG